MKHTFLALLITVAFVSSLSADPSIDLLAKVKAKYGKCKSYSCNGYYSVATADRAFKSEMTFNIRFKRPLLLRVDWFETSPGSSPPVPCSLYVKDGAYYGVPSYRRKPEKFANLESGMCAYAGISNGATYFIPSFLLGKNGYFNDYTCNLAEDEKVNGHNCHTIVIVDKRTGTWQLSIDKANLAILRSKQKETITAEE